MNLQSLNIAELLPHAPPAILLDKVTAKGDNFAETEVTIHDASAFFVANKGVPAHVGIEYMAQCCGVFSRLFAESGNGPAPIGFLLGTRNFHATQPWFLPGSRLIVHVKEDFNDNGMARFSCHIQEADKIIATADLNVYQPVTAQ